MSLDNTASTSEEKKKSSLDEATILARGGEKMSEDVYLLPGNVVIRLNGQRYGFCPNYRNCNNYHVSNTKCCLDKGMENERDVTGECYDPIRKISPSF